MYAEQCPAPRSRLPPWRPAPSAPSHPPLPCAAAGDGQRKCMDRRACAVAYLKGWFLADLLSTVPWDLLLGEVTGLVAMLKVAKVN